MTTNTAVLIDMISAVERGDTAKVVSLLTTSDVEPAAFISMIRMASYYHRGDPMYYRRVLNAWKAGGAPALKPAERRVRIQVLSDGTVQGLIPFAELFLAAYGIRAEISVGAYDSVEQTAFTVCEADFDCTFVILSDFWLARHLGAGPTASQAIDDASSALASIIEALERNRTGEIFVANFSFGSWVSPGPAVRGHMVGHESAVRAVNAKLQDWAGRAQIVDLAVAVHRSQGIDGVARVGYLRTHAPFSDKGLASIAREFATATAYAFGKGFRALLTDWDNTLWGGEVGELGSLGVVCGQEDPDALGYYVLQRFMQDVTQLGIALAAISRNSPDVIRILDENPNLALRRKDFATFALGWGNKSDSAKSIASDLNFGTDLMLYVDDNPVDLAEVLSQHPWIDVVIAGPMPDMTLDRLAGGAFFNVTKVSQQDVDRTSQLANLVTQRRMMEATTDPAEFLKSLDMRLKIENVSAANRGRILQLLQKTNQFNLTTKRHSEADLQALIDAGADVGVFSYSDRFGPQGIIGLGILWPTQTHIEIDTWLMSCRVLNRGVELAMFDWVLARGNGRDLVGYYYPTEKNGLVAKLYTRLGFDLAPDLGAQAFRYRSDIASSTILKHELTCEHV